MPRPPAELWFDLVIDGLATYRLTRLITVDVITEPLRSAVVSSAGVSTAGDTSRTAAQAVDELDDPPALGRLVTCRWCTGVWVAAAIAGARHLRPAAWAPLARALALSSVGVLLASLED
jgi:hypothetical protein